MRQGFSYIELVISIVLVGISVVSVPKLISYTVQNTLYVLENDAIFRADGQIKAMMTHLWDKNSINTATGERIILDVSAGESALNRVGTSLKRQGSYVRDKDRKYNDTIIHASAISGGGALESVDDFNTVVLVFDSSTTSHVLDFNLSMNVSYISDATDYSKSTVLFFVDTRDVAPKTTNMKLIKVNVLNKDAVPYSTLYGFISNIGEAKILHKEL